MSEHSSHIAVTMGSERSFGIVFAILFGLIGAYPLLDGGPVRAWALAAAAVFAVLALVAPRTLAAPNRLWFKLGLALGAFVAPIVMTLVYVVTVVPVGLALRLAGKDPLRRKQDPAARSYWIPRDKPVGSMKDQF